MSYVWHLFIAHRNQRACAGAWGPRPQSGERVRSKLCLLLSSQKSWQTLPNLSTSQLKHAWQSRHHGWRTFCDGIYYTWSGSTGPVNLCPQPPPPWGCCSAGMKTRRLKCRWWPKPTSRTAPFQKQPKPAPSRPHWSPMPPAQTRPHSLRRREGWGVGAALPGPLSSSPSPTCPETHWPNPA